jgi:hypothetical protein
MKFQFYSFKLYRDAKDGEDQKTEIPFTDPNQNWTVITLVSMVHLFDTYLPYIVFFILTILLKV